MKPVFPSWNPIQWVADLIHVWRDTRLIVLTAQIAAIYAAILIPFKVGIPLIPGFAELRPANAIPIVSSLLFGPAAAWGAGIGNIIGDCFGTLGPASVFGFLGNFLYGYVPYLLWGNMGPLSSGQEPLVRSWRQGLEYGVVCVVASWICAATIAWGVELLGLLPFSILAPAIFFNNVIMSLVLGPPLLLFLYPRVKRWGLRYQDLRGGAGIQDFLPVEGTLHQSAEPHGKKEDGHESFVQLKDVTFQYGGGSCPTLQSLSLHIRRGESLVLMGRSGSGKSTVCYTLNGLIPQFLPGSFSGSVTVNGQSTTKHPVWQQAETVGLVFQDFETQLVSTNVEAELAHPLEHLRVSLTQADMRKRIHHALHRVGLSGLEGRDPLSLSGGQRQRLVLASMLVREPALLVLDQPLTDLDPAARRQFLEFLQNLKQQGMTLIQTEHEPEDVLHADRVCVLDEGGAVWEGTPMMLLQTPGLAKQYGIRPLPLSQCFVNMGLEALPMTVEEAWKVADERGMILQPRSPHEAPGKGATKQEPCDSLGNIQPFLIFDHVSFAYHAEIKVLEEVSFTIKAGEFVALLGQNGSGKSTIGKLMNGLLQPTYGRVLVNGRDTRHTSVGHLATVVGYVFQNPDHQIFAETVWDEIAFGAKNAGCTVEECARRVEEALDAVELPRVNAKTLDPFSLTKGERQRVAVASVLAARPHILIFDEPTTGLDAEEADRMMRMIQRLNLQGHTIIVITHAMWLVAEYASRCLVLKEGRVLGDGSTREIFSHPDLMESASLELPSLTRFSQRWGYTLLTVEEVTNALRQP